MIKDIILGPPGTGKTTYLLDVLEKELLECEPNEIAFVSFTREGAYQGRNRAMEKFGFTESDFPYFRTLHSIAFREFKISPGQMITKKHYKLFSKVLNMNIRGYYDFNMADNDDLYLFYIDLYRNNKERAQQIIDSINMPKLKWVESNYRELKRYYSILDFTDLITRFVKEEKTLPVKVAIIDEAQDLTALQWAMVATAFKNCERIYIAGDDDQAIYEWSGADVNHFINLTGRIKTLGKSYRLPGPVLDFAKGISRRIRIRVEKDFEPTGDKGHVISINEISEVEINPEESYLFLSRNNMFLPSIVEHLMRKAVVFTYQNKSSVTQSHVTAINTYVRMQKGTPYTNKDYMIMRKHIHAEITDVEKVAKNLEWYDALNLPNDLLGYYRDLLRKKTSTFESKIKVNTIHSVKGAEADNVILSLNVTRSVYQNIQMNPDSEHRVFYVGATRAKKNLYILLPDQRYYYDVL